MTGEGGVVAQGYRAIPAMFVNLSGKLRLQFKNPSFNGLQGSIDGVHAGTLRGWAHAGDGQRLALIVKKNGAYVGECAANAPRADLAALGMGDGRYGFSLPVPRDFAVQIGDVLEVIDAARPSRKMALRMTRRVVARPGWKGPFAKGADSRGGGDMRIDRGVNGFHNTGASVPAQRNAFLSGSDSVVSAATADEGLAIQYAKLAGENRQLRALVTNYETELQLNLLQLRQVQEELESWFLKYLDLQAEQKSSPRLEDIHAHQSGVPTPSQGKGRRS